jgi:hypothetical protein
MPFWVFPACWNVFVQRATHSRDVLDKTQAIECVMGLLSSPRSDARLPQHSSPGQEQMNNDSFFNAGYVRGENVVYFERYLQNCMIQYGTGNFFAPYLCLCQSSGYGKTKLLTQLSDRFRMVFICLREPGSGGIPSRTPVLAELLLNCKSVEEFQRFVEACVLGALTHDRSILTSAMNPNNRVEAAAFGNAVKDLYGRADLADLVPLPFDVVAQHDADCAGVLLVLDEASVALLEKDKPLADSNNNRVHGELPVNKDEAVSKFRLFRRALRIMVPVSVKNVFCVLADTTFKLSNFAPQLEDDPSTRVTGSGWQLFPPYYHMFTLGQLVCAAASEHPRVVSIRGVRYCFRLSNLAAMSRPMFAVHWNNLKGRGPVAAWISLRDLAKTKLGVLIPLFPNPSQDVDRANLSIKVASLIACRINFVPVDVKDLVRLVGAHMATLEYVSESRDFLGIKYVEEPALGEAAAHAQALWTVEDFTSYLRVFQSDLFRGKYGYLHTPGNIGEAVAMIVLCRVFDVVANNRHSSGSSGLSSASAPKPADTIMSDPVSIVSFVSKLCGMDETLVTTVLADSGMTKGAVGILQFVKVESPPTAEVLIAALKRRVAIACRDGEGGVDLLVPVVLPKEELTADQGHDTIEEDVDLDTITVENLGVLLVQVKNFHGTTFTSTGIDEIVSKLTQHGKTCYRYMRYFGIVMSVGTSRIQGTRAEGVLAIGRHPCLHHNLLASEPGDCFSVEAVDLLAGMTKLSPQGDKWTKLSERFGLDVDSDVKYILSPCSSAGAVKARADNQCSSVGNVSVCPVDAPANYFSKVLSLEITLTKQCSVVYHCCTVGPPCKSLSTVVQEAWYSIPNLHLRYENTFVDEVLDQYSFEDGNIGQALEFLSANLVRSVIVIVDKRKYYKYVCSQSSKQPLRLLYDSQLRVYSAVHYWDEALDNFE